MWISWETIYYFGRWVTEDTGEDFKIPGNFRCSYIDPETGKYVAMICVMTDKRSVPGHGDPTFEYKMPKFLNELTLETIDVGNNSIRVDESIKGEVDVG